MKIAKDKVVAIDYTLTDPRGKVIDTSEGRGPLTYLHGSGNIIPGLEKALEGRGAGDELTVTVDPAEGYGQKDEQMVQQVPRAMFEKVKDLEVGMSFQARSEQGVHTVNIVAIEGDTVTVDANHPLAGVELKFEVAVVSVRDATPEELSHGHVHGPGGHHH